MSYAYGMGPCAYVPIGAFVREPQVFPTHASFYWSGAPLMGDRRVFGYDDGGTRDERMLRMRTRESVHPEVYQSHADHPDLGGDYALNVDERKLPPWVQTQPQLYKRFI